MSQTQPELDLTAQFLPRLVGVIKSLRDNAKDDPEVLVYIGSIASDVIARGGKNNWPELKAALSNEAYDGFLKDCQKQASTLNQKGDHKGAYAIEVIVTSVIASRIGDEKIVEGNKLLDDIINRSAKAYNTAKITPN